MVNHWVWFSSNHMWASVDELAGIPINQDIPSVKQVTFHTATCTILKEVAVLLILSLVVSGTLHCAYWGILQMLPYHPNPVQSDNCSVSSESSGLEGFYSDYANPTQIRCRGKKNHEPVRKIKLEKNPEKQLYQNVSTEMITVSQLTGDYWCIILNNQSLLFHLRSFNFH